MIVQLLSDLHLETELFDPEPAPQAEVLVLAGDIDSTWAGYERFAGWPVPVIVVAGNHEFDEREVRTAWQEFGERCSRLGLRLLERESIVMTGADGRRIRFLGTVRWTDFELFGLDHLDRTMRAGAYFQRVMRATLDGQPFDAAAVRQEALACGAWLSTALTEPAAERWEATAVITHFAPSLRSADPRYGGQPGTGSFCNADDAWLPMADLWMHGHLHCRHDYQLDRPGRPPTRVVCQARGLESKLEHLGFDGMRTFEV